MRKILLALAVAMIAVIPAWTSHGPTHSYAQSVLGVQGDEFNNDIFAAPFTPLCGAFAFGTCPDPQGPSTWSLNSQRPGFLRIMTQFGSLVGTAAQSSNNARNFIVQPVNPAADYTITTSLNFPSAASGNFAYTTAYGRGELTAVDISDPAHPSVAGESSPSPETLNASGIFIANGFAYVASKNRNASQTNGDDGTGKVVTHVGDVSFSTSVALQPDGKIVVTGYTSDNVFVVLRYNADGTPDTTVGRIRCGEGPGADPRGRAHSAPSRGRRSRDRGELRRSDFRRGPRVGRCPRERVAHRVAVHRDVARGP